MQFRCAPGAVRVYAQASNQPDTLAAARDRELEKLVYACYASFSAPLLLAEGQFLFPAGSVIACKLHSTQTFEHWCRWGGGTNACGQKCWSDK